ncbi:MAG: hypothetical protein ABW217_15580 [Polyangiaceae bacterium]
MLAACSLTTACFLNPKTDDLPRNVNGPGVVVVVPGGGDIGNSPGDDGEDLAPAYPEAPPNLGEPPSAAAPDAGSGASEDAFPADAGADLAFPFSHDGGLDAE